MYLNIFQKGVIFLDQNIKKYIWLLDQSIKKRVWLAIIAGGQGERLFPLSNKTCPKQFCQLDEENTFCQATAKRFGVKPNHIIVITTNDRQTVLAREQLSSLGIPSVNFYQISPHFDYAGAMVKAAEFIKKLDKNAIVINTPADHYVVADDSFMETISTAIKSAQEGFPTIVGVKVSDLAMVMSCGHAKYDELEASNGVYTVQGFIEKPDKKVATNLLRNDNSACNTGINVWAVNTILDAVTSKEIGENGLKTDELMAKFETLKLAVGRFKWLDCGTLKALYEISKKTPNHRNANLGKGTIERIDCRRSLFYAASGINLRAAYIENCAVVATSISNQIVLTIAKFDELENDSNIRALVESYKGIKSFKNANRFSITPNNRVIIMRSDFSKEIKVGYLGIENLLIYSHKNKDGTIDIAISGQYLNI